MEKTKDDYLYFAYNNIETLEDFSGFIDNYLLRNTQKSIKGFFLVSSIDIFKSLEEIKSEEYTLKPLLKRNNFLSFNLIRKFHRRETGWTKIAGGAILFRTNKPNVYVAYTNSSTRFLEFGLRRFFETFYPQVASVYLSSINLRRILRSIERQKKDSELMAKKVVAYARIEDEFAIKGKKMFKLPDKRIREAEVKYTEERFEKSFTRAFENNAWIDKISYAEFIPDEKRKCYQSFHEAYLSRDGIFKVYSNFDFFIKTVLPEINTISQQLYILLHNRNRLKKDKLDASKPLKIEYDSEIFTNVDENKKLIAAIDSLKNSSISVFHGNPYLHLALVDYLDGSSYDIWVLSTKEILITPQLRASFASLSRILNHIFEKFREGLIKDFIEG